MKDIERVIAIVLFLLGLAVGMMTMMAIYGWQSNNSMTCVHSTGTVQTYCTRDSDHKLMRYTDLEGNTWERASKSGKN